MNSLTKTSVQFLFFLFFSLSPYYMQCQEVQDADGNTYNAHPIGNQVWLTENLRTTKFNDGTLIPEVTDNVLWDSLKGPGFCWFEEADSAFKALYGGLYNFYAVQSGKLCPVGWHVPKVDEWDSLINYLEGQFMAGGRLKDMGYDYWKSPNTGATDEVAFKALPGGIRDVGGEFKNHTTSGYWWTASEYNENKATHTILIYYSTNIYKSHSSINSGFSVRCLKDDAIMPE